MADEHLAGWTPSRVGTLRALWAEGKSAGQIVSILRGGLTRSGVIGKLDRLGMMGTRRRDKAAWRKLGSPLVPRQPASPPRTFSWEEGA
jgi:hypothetical protein